MSKAHTKAGFNPAELVDFATDNPYVHRLIEDASIRENLARAIEAGRKAIDRLGHAKNPAKALIEDRKIQSELRTAVEAVRDATIALTEPPRKVKKRRFGRVVLLVGVAGGAAVAASETLRTKLLDALFGAEEEFQYTPPAAPSVETPPSPVSAA